MRTKSPDLKYPHFCAGISIPDHTQEQTIRSGAESRWG